MAFVVHLYRRSHAPIPCQPITGWVNGGSACRGAGRTGSPGSSFTALTRTVHDLGLMRRRYSYYWAKLVGAVVVMATWIACFVWIGDGWWQLASGAGWP